MPTGLACTMTHQAKIGAHTPSTTITRRLTPWSGVACYPKLFSPTSLRLLSNFSPTSLRRGGCPVCGKTTHRSIGASGLGRLLSDFFPPIFEWGMKNHTFFFSAERSYTAERSSGTENMCHARVDCTTSRFKQRILF